MFKFNYLWPLISVIFIILGTKPSFGTSGTDQHSEGNFLNIEGLDNLNEQLDKQIKNYHQAISDYGSKIQKQQLDLDRAAIAFFLTYESFLNFGYSKSRDLHNETLKKDQSAYRNFLGYRESFEDSFPWQEAILTFSPISMKIVDFGISSQLAQRIISSLQVRAIPQLQSTMVQLQSIHGASSEQVGEHLEVVAELLVLNQLATQEQLFLRVFHEAYQLLEKMPEISNKAGELSQAINSLETVNIYLQYAVSLFSAFTEEE